MTTAPARDEYGNPAPRRPRWLGTSWKMTKTLAEARAYADRLASATLPDDVQVFVLPAHTALAAVRDRLPVDKEILLGAQNAHWATEGAGTGEISMRMAADAGAQLVEMGHSERREMFGETDEIVARKARAAIDQGLAPLICVGEPSTVRDAGGAVEFVAGQLRTCLSELSADETRDVLVAYEPVWAIGEGGRPAEPEEIAPAMNGLAELLHERSGGTGPRALLYGGSVDEKNAGALLDVPHVDGLFVGRSAWDVETLLRLVSLASDHD